MNRELSLSGCLMGTAVGDALGLPRESLSARRALRLFGPIDHHQFLFGRGMFSDDTEHACLTAQALLVSAGEPGPFLKSLSWSLRFWLLGLPLGTGRATLKACLKLWLGWSARHSGCWSAGNGPAMRAPILGVCFGHDPDRLRALIRAGTRITHNDPKAEWGALVIALAAHQSAQGLSSLADIQSILPPEATELASLLMRVGTSVAAGQTTVSFAEEVCKKRGVSGYMFHTVPVVLHAWLCFPDDYRSAVLSVIRCGGDTDTTAAIVGALVGARVGKEGIPESWRKGLAEWPRNERWIDRLARELNLMLGTTKARPKVGASAVGIFSRNLLFNCAVMAHVLRRCLPPY